MSHSWCKPGRRLQEAYTDVNNTGKQMGPRKLLPFTCQKIFAINNSLIIFVINNSPANESSSYLLKSETIQEITAAMADKDVNSALVHSCRWTGSSGLTGHVARRPPQATSSSCHPYRAAPPYVRDTLESSLQWGKFGNFRKTFKICSAREK